MNPKRFFTGLAWVLLIQIIFYLAIAQLWPVVEVHQGFIWISVLTMGLFCLTLYGAARIMARSRLTRLYIQLIMIAVFLKIFLCLALIIGYKKLFSPADHSFVWPFLFIYITTTIYEVIFLEKVGREKHPIQK